MEHRDVSTVAHRFKQTFCEGVLNTLGKTVRFCHRVREITPYRLALGLIEVLATLRVESIADAHRAFNALCDTASTNAQRAHAKRDRKSGRLKLGLEHVYATP